MSETQEILRRYEPRVYTINDYIEWHETHKLELSPKFQRRSAWTTPAKAYLIDTIIRGFPIPHVYIREKTDVQKRLTTREVVDGQQRLRTIIECYHGDVKISGVHNKQLAGQSFTTFDAEKQQAFLDYPIPTAVLKSASDKDVIDVFSRLNANTLPLNTQERYNAKYFGHFKQCVFELGAESLSYWRDGRIVSDRGIARMKEAELTGELVVILMEGITDGKGRLWKYYEDFDEVFPEEDYVRETFNRVLMTIWSLYGEIIAYSRWRQKALFYSLFAAVYSVVEEGEEFADKQAGIENLLNLSRILDEAKEGKLAREFEEWVRASSSSTDNRPERLIRHAYVMRAISVSHE